MTTHTKGTRDEWLAARLKLLEAEKALTRQSDALARMRQDLPWVRIDKDYTFETERGTASLSDLFRGCSQLLVYHFMFGPGFKTGCISCSAIADGFSGSVSHLASHDVTLCAVSRAPLPQLMAFRERMGWSFPWASSNGSDFNFDFNVSITENQQRTGDSEYNYRTSSPSKSGSDLSAGVIESAARTGAEPAAYIRERPGFSSFAMEDGAVYHCYSTYARGLDALWGMYQWLDRAPKGRNEDGVWWRHHDSYAGAAQ